ncbi:Os03g0772300 [Oryza sativa Japonica Group]|uniref:Uncharacterized protein n=3 Tax=Oryza sativa TaxID=4530 RepID=A0A8J8YLC3_ORYSJ|nr:hypothetical protein OsI_13688 [Oryza sativa Indica Group]EEE60009.1 hypothetical protein OsJ_12751 [Oryza sativa Japonica Group]KAB8093769.1 hypothetical protein EE612_020711 [Oryza sativa]BAS86601.1 Os03g0772300 [Oryza sativa Japonica Group]
MTSTVHAGCLSFHVQILVFHSGVSCNKLISNNCKDLHSSINSRRQTAATHHLD